MDADAIPVCAVDVNLTFTYKTNAPAFAQEVAAPAMFSEFDPNRKLEFVFFRSQTRGASPSPKMWCTPQ